MNFTEFDLNMVNFDEASLQEASNFVQEQTALKRGIKVQKISNYEENEANIDRLKENLNNVNELKYRNELLKNHVENNVNQPQERPFALFRWRLIIRIVFGYFLFARNSSTLRCVIFITSSFLYYLYEVGIIGKLLEMYVQNRHQGREDNNQMNNNAPREGEIDRNVENGEQQRQQPRDTVDYLYQITRNGVRIPIRPGFLMDVAALVFAFFCSLFPSWNPQPEQQ